MTAQWDLDRPPVVIRESLPRTIWNMTVAGLMGLFALAMAVHSWRQGSVPGVLASGAFALLTGTYVAVMLRRRATNRTLTLTAEGLVIGYSKGGRAKTFQIDWKAVDCFEMYNSTQITWLKAGQSEARPSFGIRTPTTGDIGGILPGIWPTATIGLLNKAARRFGPQLADQPVDHPSASLSTPGLAQRMFAEGGLELVQSKTVGLIVVGVSVPLILMLVIGLGRGSAIWVGGVGVLLMLPFIRGIYWPDRLRIEPDGVTYTVLGIPRRMGWTYGDFYERDFYKSPNRICYRALEPAAWPAFVAGLARLTGWGSLPTDWIQRDDQVVNLLNEAQRHWAPRRP